jgi:hypothetical protein
MVHGHVLKEVTPSQVKVILALGIDSVPDLIKVIQDLIFKFAVFSTPLHEILLGLPGILIAR